MTTSGNELPDLPEGYEATREADRLVNLTATCQGCGEVVFDEIVIDDTLEDLSGSPIHDSVSCAKEAGADV